MTMTTKGEVDVMRGIQDMGAGTKRKDSQSSSSSGSQGFQSPGYPGQGRARVSRRGRTDVMFPLPTARTYEERLPLEAEIPGFWDSTVPVN